MSPIMENYAEQTIQNDVKTGVGKVIDRDKLPRLWS